MPIPMEGTYVLVKSENFDEYLKSCGVNYFFRTLANKVKPVVTITKEEGGEWVIKTETPIKTILVRFIPGVEFEVDFPDGSGRKLTSTASVDEDANKITQFQTTGDGEKILDVREFTGDQMIVTVQKNNIICTRIYDRK